MTALGKNVSLSGQCFPVRSLTRHNVVQDDAGGAWLVAYKAEQRRRFKAVLCREPDVALSEKTSVSSFKSCKEREEKTRRKLDGFYLMSLCHVNDPLDLCTINICGKGLNQVNEDDFSLFKNVIHIDAGENNLQLMHFSGFSSLKELELPLNGLSGNITIGENDFLWLETLDLSCNNLTSNDILVLGTLPALKILHLTGNQLEELPGEMSKSYLLSDGQRKARFPSLEKLWLDQNDLTEINTFTCLAGLKRLSYLNLEQNSITCVPHLKLLEPRINSETNVDAYDSLQSLTSLQDKDPNLFRGQTSEVDEVLDSELADIQRKITSLEDILYNDKGEQIQQPNVLEDETINSTHERFKGGRPQPFPSLRHLNLANNRIEEEEGLLALSMWPALQELVVWGNPVASCGKGEPPIVAYHLTLLAGIEVTRHKPSKKSKNPSPLTLSKQPRRVQDLPPVPHNKKLLMLDSPKHPEITCGKANEVKPLPPIPSSCEGDKPERTVSPKRSSSAPAKQQEDKSRDSISRNYEEDSQCSTAAHGNVSPEDRVFLTQVDDVDNEELLFFNDDGAKPATREKPVDNVAKPVTVPKKYRGYEELLNIDGDCHDDVKLPKDLHGNVKALQYILDHPLIFTENVSKPQRRSKTKPDKHTAVSTQKSSCITTVEELGSILDKMRTDSKTTESNLGDVLSSSKNSRKKKEFREAKKLLSEVQTKYDEVRCESLRSTAIAADILPKQLPRSSPALNDEHKQRTSHKS